MTGDGTGAITIVQRLLLIWNSSSNDSENGASQVPSLCSGASRSTGSFSYKSILEPVYSRVAATDIPGSISWLPTLSTPGQHISPPQLPYTENYDAQQAFCENPFLSQQSIECHKTNQAGCKYEASEALAPDFLGMSYVSPDNYGPVPLMAPSLQAEQRQLYMPPEHESAAHQPRNQCYSDHLQSPMAQVSFDRSLAPGILYLPPRETVQHTMNLYGESVPWEKIATPTEGSKS